MSKIRALQGRFQYVTYGYTSTPATAVGQNRTGGGDNAQTIRRRLRVPAVTYSHKVNMAIVNDLDSRSRGAWGTGDRVWTRPGRVGAVCDAWVLGLLAAHVRGCMGARLCRDQGEG